MFNSKQFLSLIILLFISKVLVGQSTGRLFGNIRDLNTQEPLTGVVVRVLNSNYGASSDIDGNYSIDRLPVGSYNIEVAFLGYQKLEKFNVSVTSGNTVQLNFELIEDARLLDEVVFNESKSIRVATAETPLSTQNLTVEEIKSNPGGNFDISRVVQVLPGVGGTAGNGSFRNDLLIRGGGPSENVFYLDGIEIPVINHFTTQGAAGGPTGILNVSFIEDATLSSSAFHSRYDNALSSVLQFKQREGNADRIQGNLRLSGTELALTAEGPASKSKRSNFLASIRRSYLQLLFKTLDLPIRPNYWDFQYKYVYKINKTLSISSIGVGAIDEFNFALPKESTPENLYVLSSNPSINQWNYTQGFSLKKLLNNSYWTLNLSRNMYDNSLDQFSDNFDGQQKDESKRILKLRSQEIENKLRFEFNKVQGQFKYSIGAMAQYVKYNNNTLAKGRSEIKDSIGNVIQPGIDFQFNSAIDFIKYGFFAQLNRSFLKDKLSLSGGIRMDANTFSDEEVNNLFKTFSPRLSVRYSVSSGFNMNASLGRYYRVLPYTILGYNENNTFVNQNKDYIATDHYVIGAEIIPINSVRITGELFYKNYSNYPVSTRDGISLANQGGDFGIVGNEKIESIGKGRAYGFEAFLQQKLNKNYYYTVSYTYFHSQFSGVDNKLIRSAWDNRHLISLLAGYKFRKNMELNARWRFQGGTPYTPFNLELSQINYIAEGRGTLDNAMLNTQQLKPFSQLDIRFDKKWNFTEWTFDLYLDIQNATAQANPSFPRYTLKRNSTNTGFETTDGNPLNSDSSNAIPIILNSSDSNVLPTIGFIVEF